MTRWRGGVEFEALFFRNLMLLVVMFDFGRARIACSFRAFLFPRPVSGLAFLVDVALGFALFSLASQVAVAASQGALISKIVNSSMAQWLVLSSCRCVTRAATLPPTPARICNAMTGTFLGVTVHPHLTCTCIAKYLSFPPLLPAKPTRVIPAPAPPIRSSPSYINTN